MKQLRRVVRTIKEQKVKFSIEDLKLEDYNDDEFAIANVTFLSTSKNQHKLIITEEVLRENAKSVLGKWLVGEYDKFYNDVTTHTDNQQIFGYFPPNQEVAFIEDGDIVKASANAIISKIYSKQLCDLFADEETRKDVSVEMLVNGDEHDDGSMDVDSFRIVGVTVLGKALGREVHGSCPDAEMNMVRFSMEDANRFYESHNNSLTELQRFSEERRKNMADKKYKINKTELKDTPWGDVDKTEMRNKIIEASNRATLVKSVYMLVEDGWEDAPSEHLKYPVMQLVDDTFYYNRYGLASALAYAKQEGEDEVVSKIEKIYDKFDLDDEKKEDMAMKEIEFAAVDLGDMWGKVWNAIREKHGWDFYIDGLYEESNQKFAIIKDDACNIYRIDYSYTEDGLTLAEEYQKVAVEFVPTEEMRKFAEPENAEKYTKFADDDEKDDEHDDDDDEEEKSDAEKLADITSQYDELKKLLEDKENIIMEQTAELEDLRKFKNDAEEKEKMTKIDEVMCDVEKFLTNDQFNEFKADGMACELSAIENWENKVKAFCFSSVSNQDDNLTLRITNPMNLEDKKNSVWDRL